MATPLPGTPGDQREDHAQQVADRMAAVYSQAELALIALVAALVRKVAVGIVQPVIAGRQLDRQAQQILDRAVPQIRAAVDSGMRHTAVRALLPSSARPSAVAVDAGRLLATSLDRANDTAIQSLNRVYRQAVRQAIADTRGGAPYSSLSLSRIQAAQKALDDLGDCGITGFVDKTGRRWDLTSYVEMATRTAVSTAWDDLQAEAMARTGLDLVLVATHSTEGSCPHCLPWLGQTLSLAGATAGYPTLAEAKATGFRHPNCRCYWTPLGAGLAADVTNPASLDHAAAVYKASQRQRALERQVRKAGRRAHAAITPQARTAARQDLAKARMASAAHRRLTGLRMTKVGAARREHPFRAH